MYSIISCDMDVPWTQWFAGKMLLDLYNNRAGRDSFVRIYFGRRPNKCWNRIIELGSVEHSTSQSAIRICSESGCFCWLCIAMVFIPINSDDVRLWVKTAPAQFNRAQPLDHFRWVQYAWMAVKCMPHIINMQNDFKSLSLSLGFLLKALAWKKK